MAEMRNVVLARVDDRLIHGESGNSMDTNFQSKQNHYY